MAYVPTVGGFLGSGYGLSTLRQYGIDPLSWGKPAPNPLTGRSDYGTAPAGALQGKLRPALSFKPFGSAALVNQGIGTLI